MRRSIGIQLVVIFHISLGGHASSSPPRTSVERSHSHSHSQSQSQSRTVHRLKTIPGLGDNLNLLWGIISITGGGEGGESLSSKANSNRSTSKSSGTTDDSMTKLPLEEPLPTAAAGSSTRPPSHRTTGTAEGWSGRWRSKGRTRRRTSCRSGWRRTGGGAG